MQILYFPNRWNQRPYNKKKKTTMQNQKLIKLKSINPFTNMYHKQKIYINLKIKSLCKIDE